MIAFFRRLLKDRRGNVLVITAAFMPVVIAAAGLATDTIEWTLWKRQLQRAADSAAIAGVYDREYNGSTTYTSTAVCHDLTINLHSWMNLKSSAANCSSPNDTKGSYNSIGYDTACPVSASSTSMSDEVCVTLKIQQPLPFSSFFSSFGFTAPIITASATAGTITSGYPCILGLDPTSKQAIYFQGSADVYMPDCPLFSDSNNSNAAVAKGNSTVTAEYVGAVGGIAQSSNFSVGSYQPYSTKVSDPFGSVNVDRTDMHCAGHTVTSTSKKGVVTTTWVYDSLSSASQLSDTTAQYMDSSGTIHTGVPNCWNSMDVESAFTVPSGYSGPIYMDANSTHSGDGNITVHAKFSCSSCTLVLTNSDSTSTTIGNLKVNGNGENDITAPTSGTYNGIAIYQDRNATDCSNCNMVNGDSNGVITGAIYFPSQELQYNGNGTTNATCTMFVSKRVTFIGNSTTSNKFQSLSACGYTGLGGAASKVVRLVA